MKKRLLSMVLTLLFTVSCFMPCIAASEDKTSDAFKVIYTSLDFEWDYDFKTTIKARYKDTKQPIPLSLSYDGRIYATVPTENADRQIEAFAAEEIEFSDYDAQYFEFFPMRNLSKTGVVKGNDKGEALPFANITRAEATAMLLRFLGLNQIAMMGGVRVFDDVTSDKWYYREVLSAYYYGLVKGDSENTFSPERNISREEFTVMAARAVELARLGYPGNDNMSSTDYDKISDWAKDAYEKLGNYVVTDVDNTDPENPKRIINPQVPATRYYVASLLYDLELRCQVYPSQIAQH